MTLKDQFDVEGYDSTLGYVGRAFKPRPRDCVLVGMLKRMGAVIVAKSNLPQSIMVCGPRTPRFYVYVLVVACSLPVAVVRDGKSAVGVDCSPAESRIHPWRVDWRRRRAAILEGYSCGLGH